MTLEVDRITKDFPDSEKFRLTSQVRRADYSIPCNFSEGCGRSSDKDFNRFVQILLGSAHELVYFFLLLRDLEYIEEEVFEELDEQVI